MLHIRRFISARFCVEYDLFASTMATGLQCVKATRVDGAVTCSYRLEQNAKPTAVMWHPRMDGDDEDRYAYDKEE